MKHYPIAKPYITKDEEKAVLEVLRSGNLSLGPKIPEFEKKFAERIGTKYACAVSSGTAGLHLSLIAAGIGAGDEVITSPFSFVASSNAILYVGAKPIFVDINPRTYNIDPKNIESAITKRTKAILVVHIFGQAADMDPIVKIARKHKLKIIEDACESIGATYRGRRVGTFGEAAVFAFYPNKQMTTGEGGMIVTDNEEVYKLCRSLRNQGRGENRQWLDHQRLGYNYRMDDMSAAIGIAQLKKLDFLISEKQKIAGWYDDFLAPYAKLVQRPWIAPANVSTRFVYSVVLKNKVPHQDRVIKDLEKRGISAKPYLPSIHLFTFYRKIFGYKEGDFPVSEMVSNKSVALPFYIGLKKSDIGYICKNLVELL